MFRRFKVCSDSCSQAAASATRPPVDHKTKKQPARCMMINLTDVGLMLLSIKYQRECAGGHVPSLYPGGRKSRSHDLPDLEYKLSLIYSLSSAACTLLSSSPSMLADGTQIKVYLFFIPLMLVGFYLILMMS